MSASTLGHPADEPFRVVMHERNPHGTAALAPRTKQLRFQFIEIEPPVKACARQAATIDIVDVTAAPAGAFDLGVGIEVGQLQVRLPVHHQKSSARGMRV